MVIQHKCPSCGADMKFDTASGLLHCESCGYEENINITYISSRKNDGDEILLKLSEKLENNEEFTIDDYISKFTVPFMSRKDEDEFRENYSKFIEKYRKSEMELPTVKDLLKHDVKFNRIF